MKPRQRPPNATPSTFSHLYLLNRVDVPGLAPFDRGWAGIRETP